MERCGTPGEVQRCQQGALLSVAGCCRLELLWMRRKRSGQWWPCQVPLRSRAALPSEQLHVGVRRQLAASHRARAAGSRALFCVSYTDLWCNQSLILMHIDVGAGSVHGSSSGLLLQLSPVNPRRPTPARLARVRHSVGRQHFKQLTGGTQVSVAAHKTLSYYLIKFNHSGKCCKTAVVILIAVLS